MSIRLTSLPAEILDLGVNSFSGFIPETIGQLESLMILDLESNFLNGTMPAAITQLGNLGKEVT